MPTFIVTEAPPLSEATVDVQYFDQKRHRPKKHHQPMGSTVETRNFLRDFSDEIQFAKLMLTDAEEGAQLPHHLKDKFLRYTNEETKDSIDPQHTYFKFNGKIFAALKGDDTLGRGAKKEKPIHNWHIFY